jgi:hypothetical protein
MTTSHPSTPADDCKDIPGFLGYRIDRDGNGWSCRKFSGGLGETWRRLNAVYDRSNGYYRLSLRRGGKSVKRYIHHLVLETFVGPCPAGMECLHSDRDKANNRIGNIRWGTPVENQADKLRHGTTNRGQRHPLAKLSEADVRGIFAIRREIPGVTMEEVGILYGVNKKTIGQVLRRTNWGWLDLGDEGVDLGRQYRNRKPPP